MIDDKSLVHNKYWSQIAKSTENNKESEISIKRNKVNRRDIG